MPIYSLSFLVRREDYFELSLEKYGIEDSKASGSISHFVNENGKYEVCCALFPFFLLVNMPTEIG